MASDTVTHIGLIKMSCVMNISSRQLALMVLPKDTAIRKKARV